MSGGSARWKNGYCLRSAADAAAAVGLLRVSS